MKKEFIAISEKMRSRIQPETYTISGVRRDEMSQCKWWKVRRTLGVQKTRFPRKLRKAARSVHLIILNEDYKVLNPVSKANGDVNLQMEIDNRIEVDGRRTRMKERVVALALRMLGRIRSQEMERFIQRRTTKKIEL